MEQKTPATYYLAVHAGPQDPETRIYLAFYDEDHTLVAQETREWTSFCFTWKDLVLWVEDQWMKHGGVLNHSLHHPSPFVDLT